MFWCKNVTKLVKYEKYENENMKKYENMKIVGPFWGAFLEGFWVLIWALFWALIWNP